MKKPMLFTSFIRRLRRQMVKHKMQLEYNLSTYGVWVNLENEKRFTSYCWHCACVLGINVCGEKAQKQRRIKTYGLISKLKTTNMMLTGWSYAEITALENGFEQWGADKKPCSKKLLPFYELGQKIRNTMGKAA